jgi:hypothetical protein
MSYKRFYVRIALLWCAMLLGVTATPPVSAGGSSLLQLASFPANSIQYFFNGQTDNQIFSRCRIPLVNHSFGSLMVPAQIRSNLSMGLH